MNRANQDSAGADAPAEPSGASQPEQPEQAGQTEQGGDAGQVDSHAVRRDLVDPLDVVPAVGAGAALGVKRPR